jgi:hypothetical protein
MKLHSFMYRILKFSLTLLHFPISVCSCNLALPALEVCFEYALEVCFKYAFQDAINRQNAAFCCGILVEVCPSATSSFMQQVLLALHPMFSEEEEPGARDNAAGAVGRMLLAFGGSLPLEQVLPVLLGALPLKVGNRSGVLLC